MKTYASRIALVAAISALALPCSSFATTPNLLISEVGWGGTSKSQADEWIEIENMSADPVDMGGWTLEGALSGGAILTLPAVTLASGKTFLIANYPAGHASSLLTITPDTVTSAVSLSNDALRLILKRPDGTVVDEAGTGGKPPAGKSGAASMVRVDKTTWKTADMASGYTAGVPDLGTPGSADIVLTQPASISTPTVPEPDPITQEPAGAPTPTDMPEEEMSVVASAMTGSAPIAVHVPPGSILINEFFADPIDGDEWIELFNPYANVLPLAGWSVRDKSGARTALPEGYLGFDQYLVLKNPVGKLNNGSDLIELVGPDGTIVDEVFYGTGDVPKSKKGFSLGRSTDGTWAQTDRPTPGELNSFPSPVIRTAETTPITAAITPEVLTTEPAPTIGTFLLSELYPNTHGNDLAEEFIEVKNAGTEPADFRGWSVSDQGNTTYVQTTEAVVAPGNFLTLPRSLTKIALNNGGDAVHLIGPDTAEHDTVAYGKAPREKTYARQTDGTWAWTAPTPDEENAVPEPAAVAEEPTAKPKKSSIPSAVHVSVGESRDQTDGTRVAVSGTVSLVLGKRAYLRDGTDGIRLDASKPFTFVPGDRVSLTGTAGSVSGERRVKLLAKDAVRITGHEDPPSAAETDVAELGEEDTGRFITFDAFLTSKNGPSLRVETDDGTVAAKLAAGTKLTGIKTGAKLRVSGFFFQKDGEPNLVEAHAEPVTAPVSVSEHSPPSKPAGGLLSFLTRLFRRT